VFNHHTEASFLVRIPCLKHEALAIGDDATSLSCGLYYKPMSIVNDDARIINKIDASLTDDARVIIYDRHMFIVQATGLNQV
jgi:hypothetical protein